MGDTSVFALGHRTCSAPANAGHRPSSLARPCSSLLLGREWLPPTSPPSDLAHSTSSDERSWWDSSMDAPHLQASRIHCVPDSSLMNLLPDFTSVCDNAQTRCPVQSIIIEWRPRSARPATFPPASEYITSYNTSMIHDTHDLHDSFHIVFAFTPFWPVWSCRLHQSARPGLNRRNRRGFRCTTVLAQDHHGHGALLWHICRRLKQTSAREKRALTCRRRQLLIRYRAMGSCAVRSIM